MTTEADDDLNLEPVATLELITAALEAVQSQGFDVNPYSVAREAGISAETLFINRELMTLVIAARPHFLLTATWWSAAKSWTANWPNSWG